MSTIDSANRYMPMNWVPRWSEAYYSTDSVLRKLYFLGLYYYSDLMRDIVKDKIVPHFFGEIGDDRYLCVAKYHYPLTYIPHVVAFVSGSAASAVVRCTDSLGSLLYEFTNPVYFRDTTNLYVRNLDVRAVSACALSGYLDMNAAFAQETMDPDSPFFVANQWGDFQIVDQTSINYNAASGFIVVQTNGPYTVYYRSTPRLNSIIAGSTYITIDGEVVPIQLQYVYNIWDNFATLLALHRNKWETNEQLKTRCQHLTIARKPNQRIAAALGQTIGINWYTSGSAVSGVGYNDWQFQAYPSKFYISETPHKDGNNFVLTFPPTGYIQVFVNKNLIDSDSYTVSGSYLISNSLLLSQLTEGNLEVTYKTQRMKDRHYPASGNIIADIPDGFNYRGILITNEIVVGNVTRKIKPEEWRWNKEQGLLNGLAEFDF